MKLKCLATVATVYWRSNEESVQGDKPQKARVMESRGTAAPNSQPQGKSENITKIFSLVINQCNVTYQL